jgi:hypothetical protein
MFAEKNKNQINSIFTGFLYLAISMVINYLAGLYTNREISNTVTDILLNNLPVYNIGYIFVYGSIIFTIIIAALLIRRPQEIPFILKSTAVFVIIRSFFVILTHIAPAPDRAFISTNEIFEKIFFDNQLFFSGHTGLPFLFALAYKENRRLFAFFFLASVLGAIIVILGHWHYTIDVFGAYFITYTIFYLAVWLFRDDYRIFLAAGQAGKRDQKEIRP